MLNVKLMWGGWHVIKPQYAGTACLLGLLNLFVGKAWRYSWDLPGSGADRSLCWDLPGSGADRSLCWVYVLKFYSNLFTVSVVFLTSS